MDLHINSAIPVHCILQFLFLKFLQVAEKSGTLTDENLERLKVESARLEEHTRRAWRCWMWVMIAVVVIIFVSKYPILLS